MFQWPFHLLHPFIVPVLVVIKLHLHLDFVVHNLCTGRSFCFESSNSVHFLSSDILRGEVQLHRNAVDISWSDVVDGNYERAESFLASR